MDQTWRNEAACKLETGDMEEAKERLSIFHEGAWSAREYAAHEGEILEGYDVALAFCSICPVVEECLWDALVHDIRYGILGGMTPQERYVLRRSLAL